MLTIEDLRNPARKSGFDYVRQHPNPRSERRFQAQGGGRKVRNGRKVSGPAWEGAYFATAEEAAQDYCDYINGSGAITAKQLRSAGHDGKRDSLPSDAMTQQALGMLRDARAQRQGRQGYVYCIAEAEGIGPLVKLGYSTNPQARVAELQTGNGRKLFLLGYFAGTMADESAIHQEFIEDNKLQEWFRPSDELLSKFGYDLYDLYEKGSASLR